jgi:hypothetical protein
VSKVARKAPGVSEDRWRDIRALAGSRLAAGSGDLADAFALARLLRRCLGDIGRGDWRDFGVHIERRALPTGGVLRGADWPIEVIVSEADDPRRQRFTVAHELGHYLIRGSEDRIEASAVEHFCDAFASELLIPQSRLQALQAQDGGLPLPEELVGLANRLRVNLQPMMMKISQLHTRWPSFALVARPSPTGQLIVDSSGGTGGMGAIPDDRTLARIGTWGHRFEQAGDVRLQGVDDVETRFVLPPPIPSRMARHDVQGVPRSGAIAGRAHWNAYRLNNGRVVMTGAFGHVDRLELSGRKVQRDRSVRP